MTGVAGAYFKVMTDTMIITLTCSFFVTWIGLPIIYLLLTKETGKKATTGQTTPVHEVKNQKWVSFFIFRPWISIVTAVALIVCI